jgi:tetratricopeptide (TPR) repeat protein
MHEAIRVFEEIEDDSGLAHAWFLVGTFAYWDGHAREAESACERAFQHAERIGDRRQAADALWRLCAAIAAGPTPAIEAERRCEELVERAQGDRKVEAVSLAHRAHLAAMQGRFDEGRAFRDRSKFLYEELGLRLLAAADSHYTGFVEMLAGDFAAAEAEHRKSYELLSKMGAKTYLSSTICLLAQAVYEQGRYDEVYALTEEAEGLDTSLDEWKVMRACALATRGEHDRAEALARETIAAMEQSDQLDYRAGRHRALAEVLRLAERQAEAAAEADAALRLYEQKGNEVMAGRMRSVLSELAVTT